MNKTYDHKAAEDRIYKIWEDSGYFHAVPNPDKPPYCIVIPPPNITGQLHMGHALDNTLQDILIRYKRMNGFEALWLPGTDHASIATEAKIVEQMAQEGITKADVGREEFLKRAWKWRGVYGGRIVNQLKKLGSSCDWERERFTMDEGCNRAVIKVFIDLYNKGLVYRGNRIINWCPGCLSALSDIEVEYKEQNSFLWYVRYDAPDKSFSITVATSRPETILGDTAVAVHPDDERYKALVGKEVIIPVVNRAISIVADEYVEMAFGTGAVKITPGHDPNDFEVGQRTGVPAIRVFTDDGHMNENAGEFAGMTLMECREAFVKALEKGGALVKTEPYAHNVGTCYRCGTTVETMISDQWFVKMAPLAKPAIEVVKNGGIQFVPKRFEKTYFNWMENIRDWCISRQLWWGHRIPAYYCDNCGEITVRDTMPPKCPKCGHAGLRQDEDVLDTWFSSGMWPFSTLGYPDDTEELRYFYPTSMLVTGYDIIFFWVARMIVFGMEVMGKHPFDTVFVHGIVRDALGRKMSKSLGNGIDPLEVIEKHGADSLRFSLITGNAPGSDMRFFWEKVESAGNFCNKIYNAARFVLMNIGEEANPDGTNCGEANPNETNPDETNYVINPALFGLTDKWILHKLNGVIDEVTTNLDAFDLGLAAQKVYDFIWSAFCDWYIEMAKPRLYGENAAEKAHVRAVLRYVLIQSLKLLHPFMPFISEELYRHIPGAKETIMLAGWPERDDAYAFDAETDQMEQLMELIRAIRNMRAEMNVPPAKRIALLLMPQPGYEKIFSESAIYLNRLAGVEKVHICTDKAVIPQNAVSIVSPAAEAFAPLDQLMDIEKERERVEKEIVRVQSEIARAKGKLKNTGFMQKAPAGVVQDEKNKLQQNEEMLQKLFERKENLG
ncbi:MAG: valine--tRNA ligase [Clostridiales bacterium]|nr:valine--tRNA ligase [Clostridiales bacterium]